MKIYQIDAFSDKVFRGNPAAVVPLEKWPEDKLLQAIALENNLSETAFYVPNEDFFELRWFTPTTEVELCGHATLSAAHVLFEEENYPKDTIEFHSRYSGVLTVTRSALGITMDFPADIIEEVAVLEQYILPFNAKPTQAFRGKSDLILLFDSESIIQHLEVNMRLLEQLDVRGVIATAAGDQVDFVSRFFGPRVGVPEDPVTGSAHTSLTVLWHNKTQKDSFKAMQLSKRGGELHCKLSKDRVLITGKAVTFMAGELRGLE